MPIFGLRRRARAVLKAPTKHHSLVTWESGHVCASVIKVAEGAAEIIGVATAPVHGIGRTSHPDLDRWFSGCDRALTQAEDMTPTTSGRKVVPDHVIMSVPTEVTSSVSAVASHHRRRDDRVITLDELRALVKRGYRKAQDLLDTPGRRSDDIVCGSIARAVLDGQTVVDPLGLLGEELELHMTFSLLPLEWIRALEIITERLELELTTIVPHHMAYVSPLPDPAALMIFVDRHLSVINMVRRGRVEWTATVESGQQELISAAATALGLPESQADIVMRTFRAGQLREDVEAQLARAFWVELRTWMRAIAAQAMTHVGSGSFPHRIYVFDSTRRVSEVYQCLKTPFWEESLPFDSCPDIVQMGLNTVPTVLDCTAQANGTSFLLLRALAHYVAQLYATRNELDRALVETIRWRRPSTPLIGVG